MDQNTNEKINSTYSSEIPPKEMFNTMKQNTYNFNSNEFLQNTFPEYFTAKTKILPILRKITDKIGLKSQTFFLSIYYLDIIYASNQNKKLQNKYTIISLSCLVLSAKHCENDPFVPKLRTFVNLYNHFIGYKNTLTLKELFYYEVVCLKLLNYKLNYFTVYDFNSFLLGHGILKKTQIKDIMNSNYNDNVYNNIQIVKKILEKIYKKSRYYLDCFMYSKISWKYNSLLISIYIMKKSVDYVLLKEYKLKKYDYSAKEQIITKNSRCFNEIMLDYYNMDFESNEEYHSLINDKEFKQIFTHKNLLQEKNNLAELEFSEINEKEDKIVSKKYNFDDLQNKIRNLKKLGHSRILASRNTKNNDKSNCNLNITADEIILEKENDNNQNPLNIDQKNVVSKFDLFKKHLNRSKTLTKLIDRNKEILDESIDEDNKSKSKIKAKNKISPITSPLKIYNKRNKIISNKIKNKIIQKMKINVNHDINKKNSGNKINITDFNKKNETDIKNNDNKNIIDGNSKNKTNVNNKNHYTKINIHANNTKNYITKNNSNIKNDINEKNNKNYFNKEKDNIKKNNYNNEINKSNNNTENSININNKIHNDYFKNNNNYNQLKDEFPNFNQTDPSKMPSNSLSQFHPNNQPSNILLNKSTGKSNKPKLFSSLNKLSNKPYLKKVVMSSQKNIQTNFPAYKNPTLISNKILSDFSNVLPFPSLTTNINKKNGEDIQVNLYEVNNYSTVINKKNITNNFISDPQAFYDLKKKINFNEKNATITIKNNEASYYFNNTEKKDNNKIKMIRSRAYTTKLLNHNCNNTNIDNKIELNTEICQNSEKKNKNNLIQDDQIYVQTFDTIDTPADKIKHLTILNDKNMIYPTNKKINYFDYYFYNYNENNNDDIKNEEKVNYTEKSKKLKKKKKKKKMRDKNIESNKKINFNNNTIE